jgi:hypothetical protein
MALTNAEHQAKHRAKIATELTELRRRVAEQEAELEALRKKEPEAAPLRKETAVSIPTVLHQINLSSETPEAESRRLVARQVCAALAALGYRDQRVVDPKAPAAVVDLRGDPPPDVILNAFGGIGYIEAACGLVYLEEKPKRSPHKVPPAPSPPGTAVESPWGKTDPDVDPAKISEAWLARLRPPGRAAPPPVGVKAPDPAEVARESLERMRPALGRVTYYHTPAKEESKTVTVQVVRRDQS